MSLNDPSVQSVIEYAVSTLRVEHSGNHLVVVMINFADVIYPVAVIICGHSGCGGIKAAWEASKVDHSPDGSRSGFVMEWLAPLVQLSKDLGLHLEPDKDKALPRLTVENVKQQVLTAKFV